MSKTKENKRNLYSNSDHGAEEISQETPAARECTALGYFCESPWLPRILRNNLIVYRGVDKACEVFMSHEKDPKIVHPTVDHIWACRIR